MRNRRCVLHCSDPVPQSLRFKAMRGLCYRRLCLWSLHSACLLVSGSTCLDPLAWRTCYGSGCIDRPVTSRVCVHAQTTGTGGPDDHLMQTCESFFGGWFFGPVDAGETCFSPCVVAAAYVTCCCAGLKSCTTHLALLPIQS